MPDSNGVVGSLTTPQLLSPYLRRTIPLDIGALFTAHMEPLPTILCYQLLASERCSR